MVRTIQRTDGDAPCLAAGTQDSAVRLMATAVSADDARVKLEALECGVDGVLLRTDDPLQANLQLPAVLCGFMGV